MAGKKPQKKLTAKQKRDIKIWKLARQNTLLRDGELELDLDAKVSELDENNGAYIQTWMWVDYDDTELDKGDLPGPKDWSPIKKREATRQQIWKLAEKSNLLRDGELELDLDARVSAGDDNGAYVETWMWVDFDGSELDKESE